MKALVTGGLTLLSLGCSPLAPDFNGGTLGTVVVEQDAGVDAGSQDAGVDAGLPVCGAVPVETGDCGACQASQCCVTLSNCAANPDCSGLWTCQRACTTNTCLNQCRAQFPNGAWDFSGLLICASAQCTTACRLTARACGGIGLTTASCNSCVQQQCCAESSACAANDSCPALIYQCIDKNGCGSTTDLCGTQCREAYDAGVGVFETLRQCALTKCPAVCAGL